jgi:nicotinamidase/pyrazinamidase
LPRGRARRPAPARAAGTIKPDAKSALIVVDVQNCFIDGGTLPVKGGAEVVPVINKLAASFENIVVTQDWHTPGHASFASTHAGKKPFETTAMPYGTQVLWPDHCVQGSDDAALHKDLKLPTATLIIRKGFRKASTATRPSRRPTARPERAWRATSRSAASRRCS